MSINNRAIDGDACSDNPLDFIYFFSENLTSLNDLQKKQKKTLLFLFGWSLLSSNDLKTQVKLIHLLRTN
jgi:hypothetical protein